MLLQEQRTQDLQYLFPYHYLVEYKDGNVCINRHWAWAINYLGRIELVCRTISELKFDTLLDVGCGDGKLVSVLSSKYKDKKFCGIDYSRRAIGLARALCDNSNVEFKVENIITSEKKHKYDVVTLIEVVEHLPPEDLSSFLESVKHCMNSGAYLICTVPSLNLPVPKKHFQHFSMRKLEELLKNAGLDVVHGEMIDGNHFAFSLFKKVFINRLYYVNSPRLQNYLYSVYKRLCLNDQGQKGNAIFMIARNPTK